MKVVRTMSAALLFAGAAHPAVAATYSGIGPYYTINDIKAVFPNATTEVRAAAWMKKNQKLIALSGPGIDGLVVAFLHDPFGETNPDWIDQKLKDTLEWEDGGVFVMDHVRWVPETRKTLAQIKAVYGSKFTTGTDSITFGKYCAWKNGEIVAHIGSDGSVLNMEYFPSVSEKISRLVSIAMKADIRTKAAEAESAAEAEAARREEEQRSKAETDVPAAQAEESTWAIGEKREEWRNVNGVWKMAPCVWDGNEWVLE